MAAGWSHLQGTEQNRQESPLPGSFPTPSPAPSTALGMDPGHHQDSVGRVRSSPPPSARKIGWHVFSGAPVWGPCHPSADAMKPPWRCQPLQRPNSLVTC